MHPGCPHGHNRRCGTAAPERFSKSSTSLVPDPNPESCRGRAEEPSESIGAVLEKGSPTEEGRWARVVLGQLGGGNAKHRAGAAFASRKAQLVNEVGAGSLQPGLWRRALPLSPWAALQAGQHRAALPAFSSREFVLPLPCSANKATASSEPEKELCPKVWGFLPSKDPFYCRIPSCERISYLLSGHELYFRAQEAWCYSPRFNKLFFGLTQNFHCHLSIFLFVLKLDTLHKWTWLRSPMDTGNISSAEEDLALGIMESNLRGVKFLS